MFPPTGSIGIRRRKLGLSQSRLAKLSGISQSMLTKVERGRAEPSYGVAVSIFNALEELECKDQEVAKDMMRKGVITLDTGDTVGKAAALAKRNAMSQFVVLDGKRVVGSVRTSDLIGMPGAMRLGSCMEAPFPSIKEGTPASIVRELLKNDQAVIVLRKGDIVGIITAEDML